MNSGFYFILADRHPQRLGWSHVRNGFSDTATGQSKIHNPKSKMRGS